MLRPLSTLAALLVTLAPALASAYQVRPERPRLFFSNGKGPGVAADVYKQRCQSDPAYQQRCQAGLGSGGGSWPAMSFAAAYVVSGDASQCSAGFDQLKTIAADAPGQPDQHSFISNNGRVMAQLAVTRDWCDPALDASQKQWLEDTITARTDWYLTAQGIGVFEDDMPNVWASVALAGLALKGTAADGKADTYLTAADDKWKKVLLPAYAYAGDWWAEGFTYVQPSLGGMAFYALGWSTATDEDIFALGKTQYNDLWNGYIAFHAYAMRPDYKYVYIGDTADAKQSIELFSRYLIDMLTTGTGSPLGQALSLEIKDHSQPFYDYGGADGYLIPLFYDASKDASATPRSSLPTARWHGKGSNDVAVLRSGWGPDDTFIYLSCGDLISTHGHYEAGSFQIFRRSILSGSDGYYDSFDTDHWANYYSQHSVHANTLAIYQPGEYFPTLQALNDPSQNVNDGGQRNLRRNQQGTAFPNPDLDTYLQHKTTELKLETGDLKTFEHADCHDYVACDVTAAYDSPGFETNGNTAKVSEVTRQFIFLRPEVLVVFDRIESTDPSYDKRFLLHGLSAPEVAGNTFTVTNGPGRLIGQTLLPADADMTVIDNFTVEGKPHPPFQGGNESGAGTRLEVSPKQESARDYFLHVLDATDPSKSAPLPATVEDGSDEVKLTVDDGSAQTTLTLHKTGALGGHITVTGKDGAALCDQDLGAKASGGGGSGGGSSNGGAGGGGGNAGAGGAAEGGSSGGSGDDKGGCGCRVEGSSGEGTGALVLAVAAAMALGRRRRRGSL